MYPQVFDKLLENSVLLKGSDILRAETNKRIDQEHFRRTAVHTKAVNLGQYIFRGGIRF